MKTLSTSLVLVSLILLACVIASTSEVVTLTGKTFDDKVNHEEALWFVKFCVPWCKYCDSLASLWEDVGKAMEDSDIDVAELDCSTSKRICNREDVHSYPTFKVFYSGEGRTKYQGKRDVQLLKAYAVKEAAVAIEEGAY